MYTPYPACAVLLKHITVFASFTAVCHYVLQHPAMHYGVLEQHVPLFFQHTPLQHFVVQLLQFTLGKLPCNAAQPSWCEQARSGALL